MGQGQSSTSMVWHLHGKIDNCDELVLTPNSYQKLYASSPTDSTAAAIETLKTISTTHSLLFVGCSLDDAELLAQIHQQQKLFGENVGPHFALVREKNKAEITAKLDGCNITILTFSDFGQPLIDTINDYADSVAVKPPARAVVTKPVAVEVTTVEAPEGTIKMALLTANAIDHPAEYPGVMKALKPIHNDIDHLCLNMATLNDCGDYDYLFIASRVVKNKLMIESENLVSTPLSFEGLCQSVDRRKLKGVFVFVDKLPDEQVLKDLDLPLMINILDNKKHLDKLAFQLFNQNNMAFFDKSLTINPELFSLFKQAVKTDKTKYQILKHNTQLPRNIDAKTVKNFVGRKDDLENICRKLLALENEPGVLTIKGAGGIGKTATAKKLCVELADRGHFTDGTHFVDCEFIDSAERFVYQVASAFDLEQALHPEEAIQSRHQGESRLIILDNVETLLQLDEIDTIKQFMGFVCDYASILVTSREWLDLEGENRYEMRQLTGQEAVALFTREINKLGKSGKGSKAVKAMSPSELNLLRDDILNDLLDNNPLVIIIITKNMPSGKKLSVLKDELENDLFAKISDDELGIFDQQADSNISRKKSIYGSILYSYLQLSEVEKKAFEILSLFPDGIDMEDFKRLSNAMARPC